MSPVTLSGRKGMAGTMPYLRWMMLAFGAAAIFYPLAIFLINSLKSDSQFIVDPLGLPSYWAFENYTTAWVKADMTRLIFNSLVVSVASSLLAIIGASMLAFGLHVFRFPGRGPLLASIIMMLTIPAQIYIIPLYILVINLKAHQHLLGSYPALRGRLHAAGSGVV
ncbi:hypothetical protein PSQ19_05315 [Devosia algicola]|uniref:Carbohydrate ABC transporter permease n=1 Tax=Devosia algicola TaxID=3026418 RepID=A0ABY7YQI3_9HYPH|nr:hypothetical protein [Devosia algicola]WDR03514.1 hypothetical protein PSQ19_05315 [Devosia algicola]